MKVKLRPTPPQVAGLNFSCATSPELLLKTFDQYCEYRKTPNGVVMSPIAVSYSDLFLSVRFIVQPFMSRKFSRSVVVAVNSFKFAVKIVKTQFTL